MAIINEILWSNMSYYFPEVNALDLEGTRAQFHFVWLFVVLAFVV